MNMEITKETTMKPIDPKFKKIAEEAGVKSLAYTLKHLNDSELVEKYRNSSINRWKIAPLGRKYLKAVAECSQKLQDCARDFRTA